MLKLRQASCLYLTSISRTHWVSGNRSHTLLFIFSLMMKEWHVLQSPIFMALLAATTCSLMLSGGPEEDMGRDVIHITENKSWFVSPISFLSLTHPAVAVSRPPSAGGGTVCWSSCDEHQTRGPPCKGSPAAWLTPGTHTPRAPD